MYSHSPVLDSKLSDTTVHTSSTVKNNIMNEYNNIFDVVLHLVFYFPFAACFIDWFSQLNSSHVFSTLLVVLCINESCLSCLGSNISTQLQVIYPCIVR